MLTHRGVGSSLFHAMLGQNPAMHRDVCLQSTLRITVTNKLYSLPSVVRLIEERFAYICMAGSRWPDVSYVYPMTE